MPFTWEKHRPERIVSSSLAARRVNICENKDATKRGVDKRTSFGKNASDWQPTGSVNPRRLIDCRVPRVFEGFKKNGTTVADQQQALHALQQTKASQTNNHRSLLFDNAFNVSTQTGQDAPDMDFDAEKLTYDPHCYECRVKFRDPKPKDLIMYLHAWKYSVSILG